MAGHLEVRTAPDLHVVMIHGDLDLGSAEEVRAALKHEVASGAGVVVDCSGIGFVDSRGLTSLICARYAARNAAVSFQLFGIPAGMRRVLRAAGIDDLFAEVDHC